MSTYRGITLHARPVFTDRERTELIELLKVANDAPCTWARKKLEKGDNGLTKKQAFAIAAEIESLGKHASPHLKTARGKVLLECVRVFPDCTFGRGR